MPGKRKLTPIRMPRWPSADALLKEWHTWVTRLDSWYFGVGFDVDDNDTGRTVNLQLPQVARLAVTGPDGIDAATSGTAPGKGPITFKSLGDEIGDTSDPEGEAYNLGQGEDGAVAPNTLVVVLRVDGKWLVIFELCPAAEEA